MPTHSDAPAIGRTPAMPARERILGAAAELFYRHGVRAVGVNAVIEAADVAKATFYQHFPSKADLVIAWLRGDDARRFDRLRDIAAREATSPAEVVPAFFEALAEWAGQEDFRGWGFINSAAELPLDHPAHGVIIERGEVIEAYFRDALANADLENADDLAQEVYVLMVGAVAASATRGTADPAQRAAVVLRRLLASRHSRNTGAGT